MPPHIFLHVERPPTMLGEMCNAHNHPPDCTCGWGGDGHLGSGGWGGGGGGYAVLTWQERLREYGDAITMPSTCRWCGQAVYVYTNEWGSFVVFDELGWPWPKHECAHAPEHLRSPTSWTQVDSLIAHDLHSLIHFHTQTLPPVTPRRQSIGAALRKIRCFDRRQLDELINMLLPHLNRDELALPVRCPKCRAECVALHTQAQPTVLLDDVFDPRPHRCRPKTDQHTERPPTQVLRRSHQYAFDELRAILLGQGAARPAPRQGKPATAGLVVQVIGADVWLLTPDGCTGPVRLAGPVRPMDYVRITDPTARNGASAERLVLLRGGTDAHRFAGWTRRFRFAGRPVKPPAVT